MADFINRAEPEFVPADDLVAYADEKVRVDTETTNLERIQDEHLANVEKLIEHGLAGRPAMFGQHIVTVRNHRDHLVVIWEGSAEYGAAWKAWTSPAVKIARANANVAKHVAERADEALRKAYSDKLSNASWWLSFTGHHRRQVRAKQKARNKAWDTYFRAVRDFEAAYAKGVAKPTALTPGHRLTFENTVVFNVNGAAPDGLPTAIKAALAGTLASVPASHFVRLQRTNAPDGLGMGPYALVPKPTTLAGATPEPETYPTDAQLADAILDEIFPPEPRKKANLIPPLHAIVTCCLWVLIPLIILLLLLAAWSTYNEYRVSKLTAKVGAYESEVRDLQQVAKVGQAIPDLEERIGGLTSEINQLKLQIRGAEHPLQKPAGLDLPPCWEVANPNSRARLVPYLFTVELGNNPQTPFRVTKRFQHFAHRTIIPPSPFAGTTIGANYSSKLFPRDADARLPFGTWISKQQFTADFLTPVAALYGALKPQNACRYYVRLCDNADVSGNVVAYKDLRALIENRFYIYRPPPDSCPTVDVAP